MRFLVGLLLLIARYLLGAVGGYALILATTSNTHDAPVEAAMTGAFVTGPVLAILVLITLLHTLRAHRLGLPASYLFGIQNLSS